MTASPSSPPPPIWNEPDFRRMAARALHGDPAEAGKHPRSSDFDLNGDMPAPSSETLRPAAVLIPVIARDVLSVLLTERTAQLPTHSGQIAFPGGKIEVGETATEAALRETHEEIGLEARHIEPLGFLNFYRTGTGYLVAPLVALVQPDFKLSRNAEEVAGIFEVPLNFILDPTNLRIDSRVWKGGDRRFYAIPYQERYIWGVTAGIIKALHRSFSSP